MMRMNSSSSQYSKSPRTSVTAISYSSTEQSTEQGDERSRSLSADSSNPNYTYTSYSTYTASLNRKSMTNTVKASNKAAILAVGEELRVLLHEEDPPLIKDRRFHLRSYQKCFVGSDMVDWLLKKGEVESRNEAVAMMQKLIDYGVVHHGESSIKFNIFRIYIYVGQYLVCSIFIDVYMSQLLTYLHVARALQEWNYTMLNISFIHTLNYAIQSSIELFTMI